MDALVCGRCKRMNAHFTFAEKRRIDKTLRVMEALAKSDDFFADAVAEFKTASESEKTGMCDYLLGIYNDAVDSGITLETAVALSAYPA